MKKIRVDFVFVLVAALAAMIFSTPVSAQQEGLSLSPVSGTNPFDVPVTNLRLSLELSFGDKHEVNYVPMNACALADTTKTGMFLLRGEVRPYLVSDCRVPEEAEHVVIRVTAIGVDAIPRQWQFPGSAFYTTTPNSVSDGVGWMVGGFPPPIVFVNANGEKATGAAVVELKSVASSNSFFGAKKGFELRADFGSAHAIVEVVGYTLAKQTKAAGGMVWRGDYSDTAIYATNDVVKSRNGTWIKTQAGWDLVAGPVPTP